MAQAALDCRFLEGKCTYDELDQAFQKRGLGTGNVIKFLRYARLQQRVMPEQPESELQAMQRELEQCPVLRAELHRLADEIVEGPAGLSIMMSVSVMEFICILTGRI